MARAVADGDDLPGTSAAVGGGDNNGRRGRTLMGNKGREPARRQRHAITLIYTKLRNSFVEIKGTGDDNNENNIDMNKQDLYGRMMGHIKLCRVS